MAVPSMTPCCWPVSVIMYIQQGCLGMHSANGMLPCVVAWPCETSDDMRFRILFRPVFEDSCFHAGGVMRATVCNTLPGQVQTINSSFDYGFKTFPLTVRPASMLCQLTMLCVHTACNL